MPGFSLNFSEIPKNQVYKLLIGLVVPRPIALVTTLSRDGIVNAAPYSFFNVFSDDPPLIMVGVDKRADGTPKDTARNISDTREFVVNLIGEDFARRMNDCAVDFPARTSEPEALGLKLESSAYVKPPRLADCPFALECKLDVALGYGGGRQLVIGEVIGIHAGEGMMDREKLHVDIKAYKPVARLFGNLYAPLGETFEMKRETFAEWSAKP